MTIGIWGAIAGTTSLLWLIYVELWRNPGRLRLDLRLAEIVDRRTGDPVLALAGVIDPARLRIAPATDSRSACFVVRFKNVGRRPITVTGWVMTSDRDSGTRTLLEDLRIVLVDGQQVALSVPASRASDSEAMWLTDSSGKRWPVRAPRLKEIRWAREALPVE